MLKIIQSMKMKKCFFGILAITLLININVYSQKSIEDLFDDTIGKHNLPLNNGKFYFNTYRTNNTHPFFFSDKFILCTIKYDHQDYNKINLKYDINRDVLVFKPFGESENYGTILIENKVNEFILHNKKFVNLSIPSNQISNGFYEENFVSKRFTFYIKHKKSKRESIKNQEIFMEFETFNEFLILKNNSFIPIKNKKHIVNLFPNYKKEINTFYNENAKQENDNKTEFFEKIFRFIDQLNSNN